MVANEMKGRDRKTTIFPPPPPPPPRFEANARW